MNCIRENCPRPVLAKGLCASHYNSEKAAAKRAAARAADRPCANCGKSLAGKRPNAIYCSTDCKDAATSARQKAEYQRRRSAMTCRWCGGPIPSDAGNRALACSRKCGEAWQNHIASKNAQRRAARRVEWDSNRPDCIGCGRRIPDDRRVGVKFCSPECKKRTQAERWREKSPDYMRGYLYGLEPGQFDAMLAAQGGGCAICHEPASSDGRGLHVDHDHETGRVRGLLCNSCNHGLGKFRDDPALLRAAIKYLSD